MVLITIQAFTTVSNATNL